MGNGVKMSFFDLLSEDNFKGKIGEVLTERKLKIVSLFGRKGKTLRNIYLPTSDGKTSEVDLVFITQKGIFIFESKNYSGWIFGEEKGRYWTAMLPNREKNHFYNPIIQNKTHLKWMQNFVGFDIPLYSVIVFSERCELKKISVQSDNVKVIKREETYAVVKEIWDCSPDRISEIRVEEIYQKLKEYTKVDEAVKRTHINNIEQSKESMKNDGKVCPNCGRELVLRTAKRGQNEGKQFYGCSGFPKCRFILDMNK